MLLHIGRAPLTFVLIAISITAARFSLAQVSEPTDLLQSSLQDLMKMEITSVSKKEQTLAQVASAIYVITQEDIQHSSALNIPDLLRVVPGLDVAQVNANTWAISARGFNTQFADKLLVLIDGRSVFSHTQDGVNWDTQDVPLEDIERIEIIRGPGASIWGANAVNGVINVITKRTDETLGGLVTAGAGTSGTDFATVRYGAALSSDTNYRAFLKYLDVGGYPDSTGPRVDGWHLLHGGFRVDSALTNADLLTAQGDIYGGREGAEIAHIASIVPPVNDFETRRSDLSGGNLLGRWNHTASDRLDTSLQMYFERTIRAGPESNEALNTIDLDFHSHHRVGAHQDLVWGAAYRHTGDDVLGSIDQAYLDQHLSDTLYSLYGQDQFTWGRISLFLGAKLEHTDFAPFEAEPSVRITFAPTARQTWWAALSQAARTPARRDIDSNINLGVSQLPDGASAISTLVGNPHEKSEKLLAIEVGYRTQINDRVSLDLATFINHYSDQRSMEPAAPINVSTPVPYVDFPLVYANRVHGMTEGLEISVKIAVTERWTLMPSYSYLNLNLHTDAKSMDDVTVHDIEGSSPRHQAQLTSSASLSRTLSVSGSIAYVSQLPTQDVASYARLDTQLSWQPTQSLSLSLVGQNLLKGRHYESIDIFTSVNSSQIERSAYAKLTWHF